MAQPVPFVPARIVIQHLQGSRNRIARYVEEQQRVQKGLMALREASDRLYLELESTDKQDAIPMLTSSLEAAMYGATDITDALERVIAIERHFQHVCNRWLKGMPPLPHGAGGKAAPYVYEPTTAREVPTPKHEVHGHYEDVPAVTADGNHPSVQGRYVDPATNETLAVVKDGVIVKDTPSPQPVEGSGSPELPPAEEPKVNGAAS